MKRVLRRRGRFGCLVFTAKTRNEIPWIEMEAEVEESFVLEDPKEVIDEDERSADTKGKQQPLDNHDGDEGLPYRRRERKGPNPQRASDGMRGKCGAERSGKEKSVPKKIHYNGN